MAQDLKATLNLPQTHFPMRGNLVQREPERLKHWESIDCYQAIQKKNAKGPSFTLHDGPPFTNGDLHLGHALNKTLKDTILRYKWMQGYRAAYIPGWDSHGLPIEHKVAQNLRAAGRTDYTSLEVRQACHEFASQYKNLQTEQFKRLGVCADWDAAYWTIEPRYEAAELETFAQFVEQGLVYRSKKPIYWSIPCQTALAEAEIEYRAHKSISIYVQLPLEAASLEALGMDAAASLLIWTTTPWTLPANLAVSVNPDTQYALIACDRGRFIIAHDLIESVSQACALENVTCLQSFPGSSLKNQVARHPFIDRPSPITMADYVTTESGTGCVHTAPGHGLDDYLTGMQNGLDIYCPIDDSGCYIDDGQVPSELIGLSVLETEGQISEANKAVLKIIAHNGSLIAKKKIEHSYPHCWRSKTPVIFRAMDQWFIDLQKNQVRANTLQALDSVEFIPEWGKNRIHAAVANRPDWCISRQRTWGLPIPAFYDAEGQAYLDAGVIRSLAAKIEQSGSDLWFQKSALELLDGIETPASWPAASELSLGTDTLDVWIDSGSSHQAVLKKSSALSWPADLYLEGSDQHRGWFQSSLWTALVCEQAAPYKQVLTHGFIVKEDGTKLSKSDGAARPLHEWIQKYGADIIRLWICSQDYRGDVPVSDKIVQNLANNYRNLRNTLRYQLGSLHDFDPVKDAVPIDQMHPLDRWALHELGELIKKVTQAFDAYEFHRAFKEYIDPFCSNTLSATYHAILKDRLYTIAPNHPLRRSSQTAIAIIFSNFTRLIAPLVPFTADEAWSHAHSDRDFCPRAIALEDWPTALKEWENHAIARDINALRSFLSERLNDALEALRQDKVIGQSLDAKAIIQGHPQDPQFALLQRYRSDLPELFILSQVEVVEMSAPGPLQVEVAHADGQRCPRSWRWVDHLVDTAEWGPVSERCQEALTAR